jgi:hypothetical protein
MCKTCKKRSEANPPNSLIEEVLEEGTTEPENSNSEEVLESEMSF